MPITVIIAPTYYIDIDDGYYCFMLGLLLLLLMLLLLLLLLLFLLPLLLLSTFR